MILLSIYIIYITSCQYAYVYIWHLLYVVGLYLNYPLFNEYNLIYSSYVIVHAYLMQIGWR